MRGFLLSLAGMALALSARAAERPWSVAARSSYVLLGPRERPTGGLRTAVDGLYTWRLSEASTLAAGGGLSAFGYGSGARWLGVLGGPLVTAQTRPWSIPLAIGAGFHADFGRVPVCNRWGLCLQYSGFYPAASAALRYEPSDRVALEALATIRVVRTLAWSGQWREGGLGGTVSW